MADGAPPCVEVRDVTKRFGALEVLKGVSFTVARGSVVSIIGASGSGKSTLLRCINHLEVPDGGDVRIDGLSIGYVERPDGTRRRRRLAEVNEVRRDIGMVFQQFNLWPHLTVLGNVVEAPLRVRRLPREQAMTLGREGLARVGLTDKTDAYPARLSGGQQQRVAIARALAMQPKVMLFDEPTSSLDPELTGEVLEVMRALAKSGTTMIVVTHEMGFAREVSDDVIFLHDGRIEEQGPPDRVFGAPRSERCRQFLAKLLV